MALRLWKKKLPPREVKEMKAKFKTEEGVFDAKTRFALYGFLNKQVIVTVDYPISTGKEADVYRVTTGPLFEKNGRKAAKYAAAKLFRIETANFQRMQDYIFPDPRFEKIKHSKREVVYAWVRKEYKNLLICKEAGVPVPEPYLFDKNVLLMEFIGEEGVPDTTLKDLGSENPEKDCGTLLGYVKKLYKHGFVHADLSEFNVLVHGYPDYKLVLIDLGQGVVIGHPMAEQFLERDVRNIIHYFKRYGVRKDFDETMKWVRGK